MTKSIEYYLSLPYTRELIPDKDVHWGVRIKELPGCMSQGKTPNEALRNIEEAMRGWLESELAKGNQIPEPRSDGEFSGKFVVRVPNQLHRQLVERADEEGVSLNQFINDILAQGVENRSQFLLYQELKAEIQQIKALLLRNPIRTSPENYQFAAIIGEKLHKKIEEEIVSRKPEENESVEPQSNLDLEKLLGD